MNATVLRNSLSVPSNLALLTFNSQAVNSGVSRVGLKGVSERRKCKWLVMVGASNGVNPDLKKNHGRGGGFPGNQKTPWIRH